jgi:hypothetical protein
MIPSLTPGAAHNATINSHECSNIGILALWVPALCILRNETCHYPIYNGEYAKPTQHYEASFHKGTGWTPELLRIPTVRSRIPQQLEEKDHEHRSEAHVSAYVHFLPP